MIRLGARDAYLLWAETYDATPNPLLALEERTLAARVAALATGRVVDVGCGTGRWRLLLPDLPYIGIDPCVQMIRGAGCVAAEAESLPVADSVSSLTLCSFTAGYLRGLTGALREFARITRPGGFVVVSDMHPASGWARAFRYHGTTYEIACYSHSVPDVIEDARRSGLRLVEEREAGFGEPERHLFCAAGREDLFLAVAGVPAVWSAIWERP